MYHILFNPPNVEGVCDVCSGELYQRADDAEETQQRRIEVYFEQTAPLIEAYRERGLLVEIDGEQSIEAVFQDLLAAVQKAV
jgi:adenylate kinase